MSSKELDESLASVERILIENSAKLEELDKKLREVEAQITATEGEKNRNLLRADRKRLWHEKADLQASFSVVQKVTASLSSFSLNQQGTWMIESVICSQKDVDDVTEEMEANLKRHVADAIGPDFRNLNDKSVGNLLVQNWKQTFTKPIFVERSLLKYLESRPDQDGIIHGFIDTKLFNEGHDFHRLFAHAIEAKPPPPKSEDRLQRYFFTFLEKAVETMNTVKLTSTPIKLDIYGCNTSIASIMDENYKQDAFSSKPVTGDDQEPTQAVLSKRPSLINLFWRKPDISITNQKERIELMCEIKTLDGNQAGAANKQLLAMAVPFDKIGDRVHRSFGATFVDFDCKLFYFEQTRESFNKTVVAQYSLDHCEQRLQFTCNIIVITHIISLLAASPDSLKDVLMPVRFDETCLTQFDDGCVLKWVNLKAIDRFFDEKRLNDLLEFYLLIKSTNLSSPILNSLSCHQFTPNPGPPETLLVVLRPNGCPLEEKCITGAHMEKLVRDVGAFMKSIHASNYVHNNLKLSNIVLDRNQNSYLVTNYEKMRKKCACEEDKTSPYCRGKDGCAKPTKDYYSFVNEIARAMKWSETRRKNAIEAVKKALVSSSGPAADIDLYKLITTSQ